MKCDLCGSEEISSVLDDADQEIYYCCLRCRHGWVYKFKLNPLIEQAKADRHPDDASCCKDNICKTCGAHVSGYNANAALRAARPEAEHEDWWMACDNADCVHAYGEGQGVSHWPDWIGKDGEEPDEFSTDSQRRKILGCTPPDCMVERLRERGLVGMWSDEMAGVVWKKEAVDKLTDDEVGNLWWELEDAGVGE